MDMDYYKATDRLCTPVNAVKFGMVVKLLGEIEMDGETTEYLLTILDQKDQMLSQLLRSKVYGKTFEESIEELLKYL